jgi:hypothetical protein
MFRDLKFFRVNPPSPNPSLLYPGNMAYYKLVLGSHLSEALALQATSKVLEF